MTDSAQQQLTTSACQQLDIEPSVIGSECRDIAERVARLTDAQRAAVEALLRGFGV